MPARSALEAIAYVIAAIVYQLFFMLIFAPCSTARYQCLEALSKMQRKKAPLRSRSRELFDVVEKVRRGEVSVVEPRQVFTERAEPLILRRCSGMNWKTAGLLAEKCCLIATQNMRLRHKRPLSFFDGLVSA